jgi:quinol monooxygenase YgiN
VNSFHVIAVATAKAGKEQELRAALQVLAAASRLEPGCRHYVPYAADKGGRFYVDEIYDSAEAFDAHLASPHFKTAAGTFPEFVEGEVVIDFVTAV